MLIAETFKKSILQTAIQGKLTQQLPTDGSAKDLLAKIKAEKQKLTAEGKIKKEKPLAPITDDEKPFEIPENWEWSYLEEISYPVGNKANQILAKEVLNTGKYPAVSQGQNLIDGYSNATDKVIYDLPVLMFGDHTRNVKLIDFPFIISADGTKFMKILVNEIKYVYYWMLVTADRLRNRGYARHYSLLKETPIPLPPLAEQKRIVEKLEELLPLCEDLGE